MKIKGIVFSIITIISSYTAAMDAPDIEDLLIKALNKAKLKQIPTTLKAFKTVNFDAENVAWLKSGGIDYLAVGGNNGDVVVYSFDGSILTVKDTVDFGARARGVAWLKSGGINYLAVGGQNGDVVVYSFNGSSLTQLDTVDSGSGARGVAWLQLRGTDYLAVGLINGDVVVYSFDGSILAVKD